MNLEEGVSVDSATINIRLKQCDREIFHYFNCTGYIAIYPFFSFDEEYVIWVMKGSHKAKKKSHQQTIHSVISKNKYPIAKLKVNKGQFLLLNSNLLFAEEGSPEENVLLFLGSTTKYPITHISVYAYLGIGTESLNLSKNKKSSHINMKLIV